MLTPLRSEAQAARDSLSLQPESHVLLADGALATLPPAAIRRWQVGLLRPDRLQHASTSFALAVGAGIATQDRPAAFAISLGVGLLKECWDARHGRFDPVDLAADTGGAVLGTLTTRTR